MIKFLKVALFSTALISTLSANENLSTKQINEIENLFLFQKAQVKINSGIDAGSVYRNNFV